MAKIYYTEAEAASKLGINPAELANYVRDGKLRSFQDGPRKMYKVEEVDKVAGAGSGEIELAPVEGDAVSLSDADKPAPNHTKEDTVITAEGISIFDDEDLEIEAADPMAKTQIAPTLDEQVSVEGVGSGSGLLDLTRESDDTSLGEVLEHIDEPQAEGVGSSLGGEEITAAFASSPSAPETAPVMPVLVEMVDPSSGAFGGLIVAMSLVAIMTTIIAVGLLLQNVTNYAESLRENLIAVLAGSAVVSIAAAVICYMTGKSAAQRQSLLRKA